MKPIPLFLFLFQLALGTTGLHPDGRLDMPALQNIYKEGELDQVKTVLESHLKNRGDKSTSDERIFSYKYLGVIYAADPTSRTRAESYFNQLFQLSPHIELADMFVSKNIQSVFDEAKRDFQRNRDYGKSFDALGHPIAGPVSAPDSAKAPEPKVAAKTQSRTWIWWTAGFAAAAAAGTVVWLTVDNGEARQPRNFNGGFN